MKMIFPLNCVVGGVNPSDKAGAAENRKEEQGHRTQPGLSQTSLEKLYRLWFRLVINESNRVPGVKVFSGIRKYVHGFRCAT